MYKQTRFKTGNIYGIGTNYGGLKVNGRTYGVRFRRKTIKMDLNQIIPKVVTYMQK